MTEWVPFWGDIFIRYILLMDMNYVRVLDARYIYVLMSFVCTFLYTTWIHIKNISSYKPVDVPFPWNIPWKNIYGVPLNVTPDSSWHILTKNSIYFISLIIFFVDCERTPISSSTSVPWYVASWHSIHVYLLTETPQTI